MERDPLPRAFVRTLLLAVLLVTGLVVALQMGMPTLRQGRLLDEAKAVTEQRINEAQRW